MRPEGDPGAPPPGAVAITGLGAMSGYGSGTAALWKGLASGISAIGPFSRFEHERFRTQLASEVAGVPPQAGERRSSIADRFALDAAREALAQAGLPPQLDELSCGIYFGSSTGGMFESESYFADLMGQPQRASGIGRLTAQQTCSPGETVGRAYGAKTTPHLYVIDGKGTHGGYCGPAVKPIALNMVAEIARGAETRGLPISGIGGVTTWRDAAEFFALGAGNVQVCTAAMTYGFKVVQEMISGLSQYLDEKDMTLSDLVGRATPNVTDWQFLNLNYVTKAHIDEAACIKCGRCYAACEDTSHQAIAMSADRVFSVKDDECVACNLCVEVCPVDNCITMVRQTKGVDPRTGKAIDPKPANWTTHPNNPMALKAAE